MTPPRLRLTSLRRRPWRAIRASGAGERVDPSRHRLYTELKGVTYHQLAVRETPHGWWARVIFDV